ncbi:MAG: AMP-binding protein [Nocardioides sp.]
MTAEEAPLTRSVKPAIVLAGTGEVVDHLHLEDRSARLAALLHQHGLRPGDTVAVLAGQSAAAFAVVASARRSGLFLLPLDPSLSLEELAYAINVSVARVLFVAEEFAEAGASLRPLTPYVQVRYSLDNPFEDHRPVGLARSAAVARRAEGRAAGTLHYSVAATGRPVGYAVPDPVADHAGQCDLAAMLGPAVVDDSTVLVSATSLSDAVAAQLVTAVLVARGCVVTPARPTAVDLLRAAFEWDATILHVSPLEAVGMAKLDPERRRRLTPPSLELVLLSVPGCPPHVARSLVETWGDAVRQVYVGPGVGVLTAVSGRDLVTNPGSVGRPVGPAIRFQDDGLIEAEDPTRPGEWRSWGDRGSVDGFGHLHLSDRSAFTLEPGGELVVPRDLEVALVTHPGVADVAVVGLLEAGARSVTVFVEPAAGARPGRELEAELLDFLRARVPALWVPARIEFTSSLPRTASGKLDKRRLGPHDPLSTGAIL